ncbi:MAG: hypothetical protein HC869_13500 [Rhodospirillales bacterium]|nr:hypothetical protein [Rhodospirillales bacterium]
MKERDDFTAEIKLDAVDRSDKKVVRNALNAGATMEAVRRASNNHYFITRDFYKTLTRIRSRFLVSTAPAAAVLTFNTPQQGGQLHEHRHVLPHLDTPLLPNGHAGMVYRTSLARTYARSFGKAYSRP